jgi:chitodextrinase
MSKLRLEVLLVLVAAALFLAAAPAAFCADDVLSLGADVASAGDLAHVPVYIRDVSGTLLDTGTATGIREIAFSVSFTNTDAIEGCNSTPNPNCVMTFTPGGVVQSLPEPPTITGSASTLSVRFVATSDIPFTLNRSAPGDLIGHIDVALAAGALPGDIVFTINPSPDATYLRQGNAGPAVETSGSGLSLTGGTLFIRDCTKPQAANYAIGWTGVGCAAPNSSCFVGPLQLSVVGLNGTVLHDCDVVTWKFSDDTTASGPTTTKTFGAAGNHTVEMFITNQFGEERVARLFTFTNLSPFCTERPTPDQMSISVTPDCSAFNCQARTRIDFQLVFSGYTPQSCDTVHWNFGDNITGTGASVPHAYAQNGTYTVSAHVVNQNGASVPVTRQVRVGVCNCSATVSGTYIARLPFNFVTADAFCPNAQYSWTFGDSASATGQSVFHAYANSGVFNWRLTITSTSALPCTTTAPITITEPQPRRRTVRALGDGK